MTIDADDDRALVARAAAGDESAFRTIVERHESAIARTVTAMLGPGDEADDVGQETFVRLFRALPNFRGDAQLRTYLTRIAVNLSCDTLERRKRRSRWIRLFSGDSDPPLATHEDAGAARIVERDERNAAVHRAVQSLDAKYQAVVVLRMLEERSTNDVAELLGVPPGTVMSRLKRALEKLAATLGPEWKR
jgi:RNA polymerase sigma-70 factor (ECF subfamily)